MGNTICGRCITMTDQDHPHIHGEYVWLRLAYVISGGSPPHTWGIPGVSLFKLVTNRITPTYMGNTNDELANARGLEDHPHIHGEYERRYIACHVRVGSPPHTWGILVVPSFSTALKRITPTYMGNTASCFVGRSWRKDHPHIHGEYSRIVFK